MRYLMSLVYSSDQASYDAEAFLLPLGRGLMHDVADRIGDMLKLQEGACPPAFIGYNWDRFYAVTSGQLRAWGLGDAYADLDEVPVVVELEQQPEDAESVCNHVLTIYDRVFQLSCSSKGGRIDYESDIDPADLERAMFVGQPIPQYPTLEHVSEVPDDPLPGVCYLINSDPVHVWQVAFLCPCGCGDLRQLPVRTGSDPKALWAYTEHDGLPTIEPSIRVGRTSHCGAHFWLSHGHVTWCEPAPAPPIPGGEPTP